MKKNGLKTKLEYFINIPDPKGLKHIKEKIFIKVVVVFIPFLENVLVFVLCRCIFVLVLCIRTCTEYVQNTVPSPPSKN